MNSFELKISVRDWIYINIIAAFFGFLLSMFFYFLNKELQEFSTIVFSTSSAVIISLFSSFFISISNLYILPNIDKRFWYMISFGFSFISGFLGFLVSYVIFLNFDIKIIELINPYWDYISVTIGFLTFLIGLILHQFISMKYKNEFIKSEILESKIKALENELNPHFLFNALNSISELIYVDKKKAEDAIINISKFLRNAIDTNSLIKLENEIDMVKTYVNIENIRFDNNIILEIDNISEFYNIEIPKFSIQLLVENAIKHGYDSKVLNIHINIKEDMIKVSNDGKISKNIKFGTGLNNLKKRLELLNIGILMYKNDNKMSFTIKVKR